mmetsp:Transcript_59748/g.142162  ORF Transcript_59748/g.142162 Transcript_59748/m.142162 type:complete len:406 (+) Transcript_59748:99-1316(+)
MRTGDEQPFPEGLARTESEGLRSVGGASQSFLTGSFGISSQSALDDEESSQRMAFMQREQEELRRHVELLGRHLEPASPSHQYQSSETVIFELQRRLHYAEQQRSTAEEQAAALLEHLQRVQKYVEDEAEAAAAADRAARVDQESVIRSDSGATSATQASPSSIRRSPSALYLACKVEQVVGIFKRRWGRQDDQTASEPETGEVAPQEGKFEGQTAQELDAEASEAADALSPLDGAVRAAARRVAAAASSKGQKKGEASREVLELQKEVDSLRRQLHIKEEAVVATSTPAESTRYHSAVDAVWAANRADREKLREERVSFWKDMEALRAQLLPGEPSFFPDRQEVPVQAGGDREVRDRVGRAGFVAPAAKVSLGPDTFCIHSSPPSPETADFGGCSPPRAQPVVY